VDTALTPHEAGAALALAAGDVPVARRLLAAAPTHGLRAAAVARLASWAEVRAGDVSRTGEAPKSVPLPSAGEPAGVGAAAGPPVEGTGGGGAAAGSPAAGTGPVPDGAGPPERDEAQTEWADLVAVALDAVAAHRAGDVAGGALAARRLAATLPAAGVDLTNFDPVCELVVLARRFGPLPLAAELEGRLGELLDGLGWPPLWTARFRWARLEAAVATRDVAGLEAGAEALATMAEAVPGVAPLAEAAAVWREVMRGHPDQQRVEQAVAALQDHGLAWEASQLAGQAAIRIDDAAAAKSLLGRARALRGEAGAAGRDDSDRPLTRAGLSEREVEVARLVLDGLTHRDIGATLYISPKTVEHHVAHIRTKLGVTNRAEFLASLREDLAARVD
jgi:DNA-binding NarL/FixJ family response regulator